MDKETVIADIKRVAEAMQVQSLSKSSYKEQGTISASTVEATFGSWNEAVKEVGLIAQPQGGLPKYERKRLARFQFDPTTLVPSQAVNDDAALQELVRLTKELGRQPSINQVDAKANYSSGFYKKRWGTMAAACEAAYAKHGNPLGTG